MAMQFLVEGQISVTGSGFDKLSLREYACPEPAEGQISVTGSGFDTPEKNRGRRSACENTRALSLPKGNFP